MPKKITKQVIVVIEGKSLGQIQGRTIKLFRLFRGLTQKQLGDRLGVHRNTVQRWEKLGVTNEAQKIAVFSILDIREEDN